MRLDFNDFFLAGAVHGREHLRFSRENDIIFD